MSIRGSFLSFRATPTLLQPDVFLSFNLLSHLLLWPFQHSAVYLDIQEWTFIEGTSTCVCCKTRPYQNIPGLATEVTKRNKSRWQSVTERKRQKEKKKRGKSYCCVFLGVWLGTETTHKSMCDPASALYLNQCH